MTDGTSTNSCTFNVNLELEAECVTFAASLTDPGDGTDPVMYIWATDIFNNIPFDCYSALSIDPSEPWIFGCEDIGLRTTLRQPSRWKTAILKPATPPSPSMIRWTPTPATVLRCNWTKRSSHPAAGGCHRCHYALREFPDFISLSQTDFDCSPIGTQTVTVSIAPPFSAL